MMDCNLSLKRTMAAWNCTWENLAVGFKKEWAIECSLLKKIESTICELKVNPTFMTKYEYFFSY